MAIENLVYLAFALAFAGYLMRDELLLRMLMLLSSVNYLGYYTYVTDQPLWDAIVTSSLLALVNLGMIVIIAIERTTFTMSRHTAEIFLHFPMLTPGQFRTLMRNGSLLTAAGPTRLTTEGAPVDTLYFVVDGPARIIKRGQDVSVPGGIFIGEIGFLTGRPASATVEVESGASYVAWRHDTLKRLLRRRRNLEVALLAQFNADLVNKVSESSPVAPDVGVEAKVGGERRTG